MKYTIILGFVLFAALRIAAQNTNPWPATGPVGIGVNTPGAPLEVRSSGALGNPQGSTAEAARFSALTDNYSQLRIFFNRYIDKIDGTGHNYGWESASTRIQAFTDATGQAYIDFNPQGAT